MHAILHLTVSDTILVNDLDPKQPALTRKVEVGDKLELNVDVTYEEFKRLVLNTAASSLGALFEHAFARFEAAEKDAVAAIQAEKMAAAKKAAEEAVKALAEAEAKAKALPAPAQSNELTTAEKAAASQA